MARCCADLGSERWRIGVVACWVSEPASSGSIDAPVVSCHSERSEDSRSKMHRSKTRSFTGGPAKRRLCHAGEGRLRSRIPFHCNYHRFSSALDDEREDFGFEPTVDYATSAAISASRSTWSKSSAQGRRINSSTPISAWRLIAFTTASSEAGRVRKRFAASSGL